MNKVRVMRRPDNSIMLLGYTKHPKYTREQSFDLTMKKNGLENMPYDDIDVSKLPSRVDRDAWEWDKTNKKIKINQPKAKKIRDAKEKIRLIEEEKTLLAEKSLKAKGLI